MFALTDAAVTLMLEWFGAIGTPTRPSAYYMALHSGPPGAAGASNELSGSGYARKQFTPERSSRLLRNAAQIDFDAASGAWSQALFGSVWSAASAGTCYWTGPLTDEAARVGVCAVIADDTIELPGHGFAESAPVYVQQVAGFSVPGGLTKDTVYYAKTVTTDDFKLAATAGGAAIDLTSVGLIACTEITNARTLASGDVMRFAAAAISLELPAAG